MNTARHAAWEILRSGSTTPMREVDRAAAAHGLDDRDRALLRYIIGTEVRRRATLRAIVQHFAKGKPSPDVAAHLRLGIAQLCLLDRVPPHAAISESVRACSDTVGLSRGRYVNGVLRAVQRALRPGHQQNPRRDILAAKFHFTEDVFRDPKAHPLLWLEDVYSLPAALLKRWLNRHGEETTRNLAELALAEPPISIVCLEGKREALAAELDLDTWHGQHPNILLAPPGRASALIASAAFQEGRVTVQGETARRAAELVGGTNGESILELCAAPGGKTSVLASTGAQVVALDRSPRRLSPLMANLARLKLGEAVRVAACDGAAAVKPGQTFDAVLADVPCSNSGVLAARPGARWRFGPTAMRDLGEIQARLLTEGAAHVHPEGRLIYSVCSIEPEEGPRRVRSFLESNPEWQLEEEFETLPAHRGPVDGGYAARLMR